MASMPAGVTTRRTVLPSSGDDHRGVGGSLLEAVEGLSRTVQQASWSRSSGGKRSPEDLHGYQKEAVRFMLDHPNSALFVDMGLGKTAISLTALNELDKVWDFNKALVIAPLRVANQTWPAEFEAWTHLEGLSYALIRDDELQDQVRAAGRAERKRHVWVILPSLPRPIGNRFSDVVQTAAAAFRDAANAIARSFGGLEERKVKDAVKKARTETSRVEILRAATRNPAKVHIINREQVEWLVDAWGKRWPYDVLIIDESSSFKDHRTTRFKKLKSVLPYIKRMHQLTATPVAENYEGLFAQIFLLDRGQRFGRSVTAYRQRYFSQNRWTYKWTLNPGADRQIADKIADITLVMRAEDHLPMDKPLVLPRVVEMTKAQWAAYRQLEKTFFLDLPDGTEIEAKTAASLSGKLLQMASGAVYDENRVVHFVHDHKIEELRQVQDETRGRPLLVAYWYQSSLERLTRAFPKAVVMDRTGKAVAPWNAGKIPMLLVHPMSAGHGLNLQYGGHLLPLFDIPWSLELYQQLIGRLARQGQKNVVRVYPIITKGTMDEVVMERLQEKRDAQEALFRRLKQLRSLSTES